MKAVFVSFGSRGDVQPSAVLASELSTRNIFGDIVFLTHEENLKWIKNYLSFAVRLVEVKTPVIMTTDINKQIEICRVQFDTCKSEIDVNSVVIINLFSFEGFIIAEEMNLLCIIVQPYIIPKAMPASLKDWIRRTEPQFILSLKKEATSSICWNDIEHFLWPLFSKYWRDIRERSRPSKMSMKRGIDLNSWNTTVGSLMYCFSSSIVEYSPEWPARVKICGAIYDSKIDVMMDPELDTNFHMWLYSVSTKPVIIGFGSVVSNCEIGIDVNFVLKALITSALSNKIPVIVHSNEEKIIEQFSSNDQVFILSCSVNHNWLFRKCQAVIHHGGSGTVASSVQVGLPQLICPFMFDQFFWAERITFLTYGCSIERKMWHGFSFKDSVPDDLLNFIKCKISNVCSSPIKLRCASLGIKIRKENGLEKIISTISADLEEFNKKKLMSYHDQVPDELITASFATFKLPNSIAVAISKGTESELISLYEEIFVRRIYKPQRMFCGGTIIDCGAHIGLFSVFQCIDSDIFSNIKVIAIEPSQPLLEALKYNLSSFYGKDEFIIYPCALGNKDAEDSTFWYCSKCPSLSTLCDHISERNTKLEAVVRKSHLPLCWNKTSCNVRRLSSILHELNLIESIDLVKIDVEGSELSVLDGIDECDWSRIKEFMIEVHDTTDLLGVKDILNLRGYLVSQPCCSVGTGTFMVYAKSNT